MPALATTKSLLLPYFGPTPIFCFKSLILLLSCFMLTLAITRFATLLLLYPISILVICHQLSCCISITISLFRSSTLLLSYSMLTLAIFYSGFAALLLLHFILSSVFFNIRSLLFRIFIQPLLYEFWPYISASSISLLPLLLAFGLYNLTNNNKHK